MLLITPNGKIVCVWVLGENQFFWTISTLDTMYTIPRDKIAFGMASSADARETRVSAPRMITRTA